ncbi:GGDEF domain-containing protein [Proteobacteria bacterium 005FR1]|nr:GGDEF domain-containing protein [Proteobacteria bacterium 005FR1]
MPLGSVCHFSREKIVAVTREDASAEQYNPRTLVRAAVRWLRAVHDPAYLAAKGRELENFATLATAITAFFVICTCGWDYAIDPSGLPHTFALRIAEAASLVLLSVSMYLRVPRWLIRAGLFAVPVFVQVTFIEILARLDQGASYGMGGFLYFFIFVPFMAIAESLRFSAVLMAVIAIVPNVLRLFGYAEHLDLSVYNAYVGLVYFPAVMILALIEHLIHNNIFSRGELERQATTDPLTGTGNRLHFTQTANRILERNRELRQPISVLFVDADHFKRLNDVHGHAYGDRVLKALAERIRGVIRETDVLARYGGEEFVILLPNASANTAHDTAERIRLHVSSQPLATEAATETLTVSVGVASTSDTEAVTLRELLSVADEALYEAKHAGRDRVVLKRID